MPRALTNTSQLIGGIFGAAMIILVWTMFSILQMPDLHHLRDVAGNSTTIRIGNRAYPAIQLPNGESFSCAELICAVNPEFFLVGKPSNGKVSSNGMLLALSVNGQDVLQLKTFTNRLFMLRGMAALSGLVSLCCAAYLFRRRK